jgi:3-deoxy-D-manno-octulosonate 8-phosphate phosphatase (KDO 8-P phosphatase)
MMQAIIDRAKKIKCLALDVDGILTSGLIYYHDQGAYLRAFHVHDGLGLQLLKRCGIRLAVISAKKSLMVTQRLNEIGIDYVYLGQHDKLIAYVDLKQQLSCNDEEIAYMGDDLPDLPVLKRVGLAISVINAPTIIQHQVHFVTQAKGGKGAVREVCDFILQAQGQYQTIIDSYLKHDIK